MRGDPRALLAASALALAAGLLVGGGVPLYDGVGYPDEAYRYVTPPPGYRQTPPPTSAMAPSPVRGGRVTQDLVAATDEQGSQASVYVPAAALSLPAGTVTATVRLTVAPLAPDTEPSDGLVDGNVYLTSLVSDAGTVAFYAGDAVARITLRDARAGSTPPTMEYRASASSGWTDLDTSQVGADIYAATFRGPGQYALVQPRPHTAAAARPAGGPGQLPLVLGGAVLLVVLALIGVRSLATQRQ